MAPLDSGVYRIVQLLTAGGALAGCVWQRRRMEDPRRLTTVVSTGSIPGALDLADLTRDGNFPQLLLDPVDFGQLYMQEAARQQSSGGTATA